MCVCEPFVPASQPCPTRHTQPHGRMQRAVPTIDHSVDIGTAWAEVEGDLLDTLSPRARPRRQGHPHSQESPMAPSTDDLLGRGCPDKGPPPKTADTQGSWPHPHHPHYSSPAQALAQDINPMRLPKTQLTLSF